MCCSRLASTEARAAPGASITVSVIASVYRSRLQHQIGGAIAGPNGTFDGCRQAGVGPIARKVKIGKRGAGAGAPRIFLWRRREGGAPLAYDLPRREPVGKPRDLRDLA